MQFTGCNHNAEVVVYTIAGMGHQWPGGKPLPSSGAYNDDINATEVMWAFFVGEEK